MNLKVNKIGVTYLNVFYNTIVFAHLKRNDYNVVFIDTLYVYNNNKNDT